MAIKPTIMKLGRTTPASQGSKYTNISCSPRKYQGAFEGFGVAAGFAGCSIGASNRTDHATRTAEHSTRQINSVYTRSGHTQTRSDSCFSITSSPAATRWSFRSPSRMEYHVKKMTLKIRKTIGTLSAFAINRKKFSSVSPQPKKTTKNPINPYPTESLINASRFQTIKTSATTERMKYNLGSATRLKSPLIASILTCLSHVVTNHLNTI